MGEHRNEEPDYSDVLYVSELIGPDVVNTMPEHTLRAFADHGEVKPTLEGGPGRRSTQLADAAAAGIDLGSVTAELEREGVKSFWTPTTSCRLPESQLGVLARS